LKATFKPNFIVEHEEFASIMSISEDLNPKFSIFSGIPEDQRAVTAGRCNFGEYFL
jgi:serine/threonine-protein phosphatase PP1-1